MQTSFFPKRLRSLYIFVLFLVLGSFALSACSSSNSGSSSSVTITLAGPNQWSDSGKSFGPAWDQAVAQFEQLNPGVKVQITVLPLSSFYQSESTELAAGTAPDLIFNQATYKSYEVTPLDQYLNQPNPYAPGHPHWIDWFNQNAYGFKTNAVASDGHLYWVPFNLFDAGLFYNKDAFTKAGVQTPIKTWEDWRVAIQKLKAAGYTPLAMDNSTMGIDWTWNAIANQLLAKYYDQWNAYDIFGKKGTNELLTTKDIVKAMKTGKLKSNLPEIQEALTLMKEVFTQDVTPNWSGIKGLSGSGVGLPDFLGGKAAMAWGANFGASDVQKASFQVGSMGWPTITSATTPLSTNFPAQFGVQTGGTSYMIPSTIKGDHLKYAVRFLQFMTAPKYAQPWITATTGVPSVDTVQAPAVIAGFSDGVWGHPMRQDAQDIVQMAPQLHQDFDQFFQGYVLGSSNLATLSQKMDGSWQQGANYVIKQNPDWQSEAWTNS